ncbi:MAG TPA: hypothetical protein RMH99_06675 [Sandaracinaceae bacterium LLY-WYZ-13_1]|nr:hypothetical protein [Sandaracinaceae bacterium LLY-WYZ-13_1]
MRERTIHRALGAIAAGMLIACGGGQGTGAGDPSTQASQPSPSRGSEVPVGADEQLDDIRLLAMDLAARHGCDRLRDKLMAIGGDGDEPANGRMWINGCEASVQDEALVFDVDALLWTFVDRSSSAVGATFTVSQYVALDVQADMRAIPQMRYDREKRQAFVWLEPVQNPDIRVRVLGGVDAEAQSLWGEFIAFGAGVVGPSENERAVTQVRQSGDQRLEQRVDHGLSVAIDLCTSETTAEFGRLTEMPEPQNPSRGVPGASTNVQVRPMGIDAAGPFSRDVQVQVMDGAALRARLVCQEDAHRMIEAFVDGGPDAMPPVEPAVNAVIPAGSSETLSPPDDVDCDLVMISTVAEGGEASSTFSYAQDDGPRIPLVAGCDGA